MAVTFDAATTGTASSATSVSATHTASGTDLAAFMHTASAAGTPQAVTGSYAGTAMTEHWDTTFATYYRHAGYTLVNPATGAQTVTATYAGTQGNLRIGVATYTGVDQTTPVGTPNTATGSSTTPSVAITSATDELVVDGMAQVANANATAGANQTERWDLAGAEISVAGSDEAGAATTTMSWTLPASVAWHIGGIAFKPAAAAATGQPYTKRTGGVPFMSSNRGVW